MFVSCCILPLSVAHTQMLRSHDRTHCATHCRPCTRTHITLVFSSNICLPTTRAMQGNDEDHSGAHRARQSTQVQARYHAREEWQQAAGHQWRRTHRKTGERRMYTTANTLLTGLQTLGDHTCWPSCTLVNKPPITAISAGVSLTCSVCLSRDCSFRCI
jgi:hypothetical protein